MVSASILTCSCKTSGLLAVKQISEFLKLKFLPQFFCVETEFDSVSCTHSIYLAYFSKTFKPFFVVTTLFH